MARTRLDLNRFKKIYPLQRKSPHWFYRDTNAVRESREIDLSASEPLTFTTVEVYNSPIVVASANENVNVWVSSISDNGGGSFDITVAVGDSSFTGKIYVQIGEGNP
jgi:hypothetical protein